MRRALLAALAVAFAACRVEPSSPPDGPSGAPPDPRVLRVELVYGDEADLDLYVSDPLRETVYFGNTPARSGGRLEADLRCADPAPRSETVLHPTPLAGRYRVSVDYPERCRRVRDPVPYLVVVDVDGRRREQRGEIELGHFEVIVLEFDVGEPGG